jgi:cellulose synthase (UDP-forming)
VLDADHVPTSAFLRATLPYFDDPAVAFVQTPQDFYNLDSFEHQRRRTGAVFNEEAVFYRVIAPAKNRWQAPFWCGTCALVRTAALRSVGGVATDSVTEDIQTSIRMFRAGWRGVYHNEVLARGLAPDDAASYLLQRNRWALGAMQVLRTENPLFGPGLAPTQRLAFLTTLFGCGGSGGPDSGRLHPPESNGSRRAPRLPARVSSASARSPGAGHLSRTGGAPRRSGGTARAPAP